MPSTAITFHQPFGAGIGTMEIPADKLVLRSVSVMETGGAVPAGSLSGRIHIVTGSGLETESVAILASGTISKNSPLFWTGEIPLETDTRIKLFYDYVNEQTIRLAIYVSETT